MSSTSSQTDDWQQQHPYSNQPRSSSSGVRRYFFMRGVLDRLSSGRFFKRAFSVVLKTLAVLAALGGIVLWVRAWGPISDMGFGGVIGGLVFQLVFLGVIYMVVHTLFIRANDIAGLPGSGYAVIPIGSILFKLLGELYACVQVPVALAGGIFLWFGGYQAGLVLRQFTPSVPAALGLTGGDGFWAGMVFVIGGIIGAFFVLLFFYFLSESIRVIVDIAENTQTTSQAVQQFDEQSAERSPASDNGG